MDLISEKVNEGSPYSILKVKLGMGIKKDKEIMKAIRLETDKVIRVDANEGWDLETGIEMCKWLSDQGVEFVEQPFKSTNLKDTAELRKKSPLPLIADENSLQSSDIPGIENVFDGINIKLMKCGSLFEALKMIKMARDREMKIMLGCMIESSIGITAAAHLSPLVDYADLDGSRGRVIIEEWFTADTSLFRYAMDVESKLASAYGGNAQTFPRSFSEAMLRNAGHEFESVEGRVVKYQMSPLDDDGF
jgi:L-alanine-DL-glutamate epimerase-like enolase superfamily enzyme